jgi:hypothetical protein
VRAAWALWPSVTPSSGFCSDSFGWALLRVAIKLTLLTNHWINGGIKWLLSGHLSGKIIKTHSSSLGWLQAIPRDFINILSGKNLLSAIYQGLILSELINLKTFVSILSGLWGFFIYQSEKRACIILVTKVSDLTELTIRMLHCLANF